MNASDRGLPRVSLDDVYLAPVHLNVGGTTYTTTLDTLTRYPESKLAKLFNGTLSIPVDSINNHYFLDVNGSVFAHILDFLRYKELVLPEGFNQLQLLKKQAEYFEIEDMMNKLENLTDNEQENLVESELSEEDHGTVQQVRHKRRTRSKKSNKTADHTLQEERVDERITGEGGEKNTVAVKGVREREDVTETVDHTPLRGDNTNIVIVRCYDFGRISIFSLAKVILEEPIPETPILTSKIVGCCTRFYCNVRDTLGPEFSLPCTLHFVNQLLSKRYHLVSGNFIDKIGKASSLREFILYQG